MKRIIEKCPELGCWIAWEKDQNLQVEVHRAKTKKECKEWSDKHNESFMYKIIGANDKEIRKFSIKKPSEKDSGCKNFVRKVFGGKLWNLGKQWKKSLMKKLNFKKKLLKK